MPFATLTSRNRPTLGLDALLQQSRRHSIECPDVLANHLPMILVALDRLGASPEREAAFFAMYRDTKGIVPAPGAVAPIDVSCWTSILGDRAREADARAFFTREVARLGIRDAISAYLPRLAPGVAARCTR